MDSIKEVIEIKGFKHLEENYIRIENEPYMSLTIEDLPKDANDNYLISVCHYGKQNGDAMRDPEMVFRIVKITEKKFNRKLSKIEVSEVEKWFPVYFRNDYMNVEQDVIEKPNLVLKLGDFPRIWNTNIRQQGFIDKYKKDVLDQEGQPKESE